jgi:hypothetical protein
MSGPKLAVDDKQVVFASLMGPRAWVLPDDEAGLVVVNDRGSDVRILARDVAPFADRDVSRQNHSCELIERPPMGPAQHSSVVDRTRNRPIGRRSMEGPT